MASLSKKYKSKIINFADIQVFENATTYSAITIFDKKIHEKTEYSQAIDFQHYIKSRFSRRLESIQ